MFELTHEGLRLTGLPENYTCRRLDTREGKRLSELRVASARLDLAHKTLDLIANDSGNSVLREAVGCAASIYYFSCFDNGNAGPRLKASKVFKGNAEALKFHDHWKAIRDQRFGHMEGSGTSVETLLIADETGKPVTTRTLRADIRVGDVPEWIQGLYYLIAVARVYLDAQVRVTEEAINAYCAKLSPAEFAKLPKATMPLPNHDRRARKK